MGENRNRRTRHDLNSEATRSAVITAARRLFAKKGYAEASLNEIVAAAAVTTGVVYHHFGDKKGLFRAVVETLEAETMQRVAQEASGAPDAWATLERGLDATLEACLRPDIRRILFTDAPNVFGQSEWREIEKKYSYGAMVQILSQLKAAGSLRVESVEILAPILLGAMIEAASAVAAAANKKVALSEARTTIRAMLAALRK
jgi:AcrR family transcriptional regulator